MNARQNKSIHDIQREVVYEQIAKDPDYSYALFNGRTALESQRKSNYKTTARAAREIIDNAIEAGGAGTNVYVLIEKWGKEAERGVKESTVRRIYFFDDGPGMFHDDEDRSMIRFALTWGGGTNHKNEDREIGKFGFGLPNASISQCRKTSVYSCEDGKDWHVGFLDIDDMNEYGTINIPPVKKAKLPKFVEDWAKKNKIETDCGTCVVWDNCDSLSTATASKLKEDLVFDFSMTYRKYLEYLSIYVDSNSPIEKLDPLFIDPEGKYYVEPSENKTDDNSSGGSRIMFDKTIDVKYWKDKNTSSANLSLIPDSAAMEDAKKQMLEPHGDMKDVAIGKIQVRVCRFPLGFAEEQERWRQDEFSSQRLNIRKHVRGFHYMRHGREIDVSDNAPRGARARNMGLGSWPVFQAYSRHHPIEFTFTPSLDEAFNVSNDKQSVSPVESFWKLMSLIEVDKAIAVENNWQRQQRAKRTEEGKVSEESLRPALQAIQLIDKSIARPKRSPEVEKNIKERLKIEAKKVSQDHGGDLKKAMEIIQQDLAENPIKLTFKDIPGGDFMIPEYSNNLTINLNINKAHEFYKVVFSQANDQVMNGLYLILGFLARQELELLEASPKSKEALTLQMQRRELGRWLSNGLGGIEIDTQDPDLEVD